MEKPGNFCCNNGVCIDSELVCDNSRNCDDKEDEEDCNVLNLPANYNSNFPPIATKQEGRMVSMVKTLVKAKIDNLNVLDISFEGSSFIVLFNLRLEWNDERVTFNFLKKLNEKNMIDRNGLDKIWKPILTFIQTIEKEVLDNHVLIRKNGNASVDFESDMVNPPEVYNGKIVNIQYRFSLFESLHFRSRESICYGYVCERQIFVCFQQHY